MKPGRAPSEATAVVAVAGQVAVPAADVLEAADVVATAAAIVTEAVAAHAGNLLFQKLP
jgi:hypothetical protein